MLGLLALVVTWALFRHLGLDVVEQGADGTVYAFWNFAIPLVTGLAGKLLGGSKGGGGNVPGASELAATETRARTKGTQAEDDYLSYLGGFDATESARSTADALSTDWLTKFRREIEGLRGSQVSRGRLDTGYGMQDEDRYVTDFGNDVAKQVAALGMDAARLNLGAKDRLGEAGERLTGTATDLAASRRDQYLTDKASKRAMYGGIGQALLNAGGQVAGAYFGGRR